ncbi:MAG: 3'-5' exonuclease [Blastococcus sp.]
MTGLVVGGAALVGAVLLVGLLVSIAAGRRKRSAAAARADVARSAVTRGPVPPRPRPAVRLSVAEPGARGPLFQYGGDGPGLEVDAPFAVVGLATTGFNPDGGDRIVEIAIARVDEQGAILDEYATVVDPGRDVGAVFVHGISNIEVREAPAFADIAGEILDRLDSAIVVMHDAAVVERFLDAEFSRAGVVLPLTPAVCSAWLARRTLRLPDVAPRTLARHAGLAGVDPQSARGVVRTVAALLPQMLAVHGEPLRYLCGLRPMPELDVEAPPRPRAGEQPVAGDGWIASLLTRRRTTVEGDPDAQRYLDVVTAALADGRLLGGESQTLTRLGASAGLDAARVEQLHDLLLEHLRAAARADIILTTGQLRQLRTAAAALGLPTYFDDLRPTSPQDLVAHRSPRLV